MNEFSVVMSVYKNDNILHFIEAVKSLINQTIIPNEIIIVRDGVVSDELQSVISKFSQDYDKIIKIVELDENKGLENALNVGIKLSAFDIIARMDADDISMPNRFELQLPFLIENNLDLVGGQIIEFGTNKLDVISQRKVPLNHDSIIKFLKYRSPFSHPTIIFKKEVFLKLNGYDTNIKYGVGDYDFFVRACLKGFRFGNINENVLWFRVGDASNAIKRRHGILYAKNEIKLYNKFRKIGYYNLSEFIYIMVLKIPIRIIPFSVFKFIYFKFFRN